MSYRSIFFLAAMTGVICIARAESLATDPIPDRLVALCTATELSPDDIGYVRDATDIGGASECLARAILFRHSETEYVEQFRTYFAIDRSRSVTVLANEEINSRVNGVLKEFKGRAAPEIATRVYLSVRGKALVAHRADGTELNLEVMFRASVFAAVNDGSKEKVLHFAAEADRK